VVIDARVSGAFIIVLRRLGGGPEGMAAALLNHAACLSERKVLEIICINDKLK
jgi:hypothetical protein